MLRPTPPVLSSKARLNSLTTPCSLPGGPGLVGLRQKLRNPTCNTSRTWVIFFNKKILQLDFLFTCHQFNMSLNIQKTLPKCLYTPPCMHVHTHILTYSHSSAMHTRVCSHPRLPLTVNVTYHSRHRNLLLGCWVNVELNTQTDFYRSTPRSDR